MLEKAIEIAARAHQGQKDKSGQPYILHPLRVMMNCSGDVEKVSAVLHDVLEDTQVTIKELQEAGISEEALQLILLLTKREDEPYDEYIEKICSSPSACHIKLADLKDNMNLKRLPEPSEKDYERLEKYERAWERIHEVLASGKKEKALEYELDIEGKIILPVSMDEEEFNLHFTKFIEENHGSFDGTIAEKEE